MELARKRTEAKDKKPILPDESEFANYELSRRIWLLMEATGWKYTPLQLLDQPDWLMSDLLQLSSAYQAAERLTESKTPQK